jgi:hypothetical protein
MSEPPEQQSDQLYYTSNQTTRNDQRNEGNRDRKCRKGKSEMFFWGDENGAVAPFWEVDGAADVMQ